MNNRKNGFSVALLAVVLCFSQLVYAVQVPIDIWAMNDFHGAILEDKNNPGIAKDAGFYLAQKAKNPDGTIFLNAGDLYQGSLEANITYGRGLAEIMNYLQLDAMAIGNHEFDWGIDQLLATEKVARFPYLACNIFERSSGLPVAWAKPYITLTRNGVKIAVIGATAADAADTTKPNYVASLYFIDPAARLNEIAAQARKNGADLIIVVAHMGAQMQPDGTITGDGAVLLNKLHGVDLYLAGHWHNVVNGKINGIPILEAYTFGLYMSHAQFVYDTDTRQTSTGVMEIIDTQVLKAATPDPTIAKMVQQINKDAKALSSEQIGVSRQELNNTNYQGNPLCILGEFITDVMRSTQKTDIAITNKGGIRTVLPKGQITMQKLYAILPFDNTVVTMNLTGQQIVNILEHSIDNAQFSGMSVTYLANNPSGKRVRTVVLTDGSSLRLDGVYSVATNDFLSNGGDGFSDFLLGTKVVNTNETLRDCVANYIRVQKTIDYNYDGKRLVIIG